MDYGFNLLAGPHLLRALGFPVNGFFDQLGGYEDSGFLEELQDSFSMAAGYMGARMLANLLQSGGIPGSFPVLPPNMGGCPCSNMYSQPMQYDIGRGGGNFFEKLMTRMRGAEIERYLQQDPFARAQVEMRLGGRIVNDGLEDGRLTVMPFQNPFFGGSQNAMASMGAQSFLDQIMRAGASTGFQGGGDPFQMMVLGALANLLGGGGGFPLQDGLGGGGGGGGGGQGLRAMMGNGSSPFVDWADDNGRGRRRGAHQPTGPGPHQGAFGLSQEGSDEVTGVLNDSSLTVEDKVVLVIMLIMKKMDKEIEKQAQYVNSLQQQQNGGGGGGGKGGKGGGGGGGGSSPSIDVETMKLKRLIDKRSQMFDMLRQIIDKYNETAKNIIQSIGR